MFWTVSAWLSWNYIFQDLTSTLELAKRVLEVWSPDLVWWETKIRGTRRLKLVLILPCSASHSWSWWPAPQPTARCRVNHLRWAALSVPTGGPISAAKTHLAFQISLTNVYLSASASVSGGLVSDFISDPPALLSGSYFPKSSHSYVTPNSLSLIVVLLLWWNLSWHTSLISCNSCSMMTSWPLQSNFPTSLVPCVCNPLLTSHILACIAAFTFTYAFACSGHGWYSVV